LRLDFGGIAKGFASDEALRVMRTFGVERALVDGGSAESASAARRPIARVGSIALVPFADEVDAIEIEFEERRSRDSRATSRNALRDSAARATRLASSRHRTGLYTRHPHAASVIAPDARPPTRSPPPCACSARAPDSL